MHPTSPFHLTLTLTAACCSSSFCHSTYIAIDINASRHHCCFHNYCSISKPLTLNSKPSKEKCRTTAITKKRQRQKSSDPESESSTEMLTRRHFVSWYPLTITWDTWKKIPSEAMIHLLPLKKY